MKGIASFAMAASLVVGLATISSCGFDGYCLDCIEPDSGAGGDGGVGGGDATGPTDGGGEADACASSGIEQCDGLDNDCNGLIDDGVLPGTGNSCSTNVGACVEGVTECSAGEIVCGGGAVIPINETCDGVDNNCNGSVDEGNPGGGNSCGTDTGECVAGVTQCIGAALDCVGDVGGGAESCDGRDNDCDGMFDEGTGGGQCGPSSDMGLCEFGMLSCIGGQIQCQNAVQPITEVCDAMDHDCDGNNLNGYNLNVDALNCGMCGHNCNNDPTPMGDNTAIRQCVAGQCAIGLCATDYHDLNDDYADGCEYGPCEFQGNQEACNGVDDDCDDTVDEDLGTPPALCVQEGECAGTEATCSGLGGWECTYGATVSTDAMGNILPEVDCDGRDNDCDGFVDEAFGTLGAACDDGQLGTCRGTGTIVCNGAETSTECMITSPGGLAGTETCDNTDEDCDGTIDEGDHQLWVSIGGATEMFRYEASRPDSSSTAQGLTSALPCSKAGAIPWTNITHPQAEAACAVIGARLCTETEWEATCTDGASCDWSYDSSCTTYQPNTCNGNDYDTDPGTAGDQDEAIPTGSLSQCVANVGAGALDMSGNIKEWTAERSANVNPIRGGSYNNSEVGISCEADFLVATDEFFFPNVGFRCCR